MLLEEEKLEQKKKLNIFLLDVYQPYLLALNFAEYVKVLKGSDCIALLMRLDSVFLSKSCHAL